MATIASSRRLPSALPRNRSLLVPPYMSAVSKKLMPASSAALHDVGGLLLVDRHAEVVAAEPDDGNREGSDAAGVHRTPKSAM